MLLQNHRQGAEWRGKWLQGIPRHVSLSRSLKWPPLIAHEWMCVISIGLGHIAAQPASRAL